MMNLTKKTMSEPIYEPEFSFLPAGCECGSRFRDDADLRLHKRETCPRRFEPNFKYPAPVPHWFKESPGGVADGGRKA